MSDEAVHPPRRSRELLRQWVDDYASETSLNGARVDVAPQEDGGDGDTGLVILRPYGSTLWVYMQPRGNDDPVWELTIPERHHDVTTTCSSSVPSRWWCSTRHVCAPPRSSARWTGTVLPACADLHRT